MITIDLFHNSKKIVIARNEAGVVRLGDEAISTLEYYAIEDCFVAPSLGIHTTPTNDVVNYERGLLYNSISKPC